MRRFDYIQRPSQVRSARWRARGSQGIGGLGHLAIQLARHMGFRVVAISEVLISEISP